jgi:predicted metal-dependent HD superfamily phosphohydrolase
LDTLQYRFTRLWQRHSLKPGTEVAENVFSQLAAMYGEEWRSYHNMGHISDCLGYFDDCCDQADNADAIEMAIWYHDCFYQVGARDNESRSRDWFLESTDGIMDEDFRKRVSALILDTCHREKPQTDDGKLLADIDLTSFGLPWEKYLADGMNVQKEQGVDSSGSAKSPKIGFLENLGKRESIYFSTYYLEHYEKAAQENIKSHLAQLQQGC